jgi:hypothetical protein
MASHQLCLDECLIMPIVFTHSLARMTLGESIIPIVHRLQDIAAAANSDLRLPLPQVAVVGSQSSGKSSVLEALVSYIDDDHDATTALTLLPSRLVEISFQEDQR